MKKRKIKLLASLTSLVLVVAVMAVGVWAATQASVGITGQVTYVSLQQVKASVKVANLSETNSVMSDHNTALKGTTGETVAFGGNEAAPNNEKTINLLAEDKTHLSFANIDDYGTNVTVSYTITVTNQSLETDEKESMTVKITLPETLGLNASGTEDGFVVDEHNEKVYNVTLLEKDDSATLTVTYTFNPNNNVTNANIGVNVVITTPSHTA